MSNTLPENTWAIVEMMGHRKLGGKVAEVTIAGAPLLRIDVPSPDGDYTQFYGANAIYCLTPTTEEIARAFARRNRDVPVQRYELALPEPRQPVNVERPEEPGDEALVPFDDDSGDEDDEDDEDA